MASTRRCWSVDAAVSVSSSAHLLSRSRRTSRRCSFEAAARAASLSASSARRSSEASRRTSATRPAAAMCASASRLLYSSADALSASPLLLRLTVPVSGCAAAHMLARYPLTAPLPSSVDDVDRGESGHGWSLLVVAAEAVSGIQPEAGGTEAFASAPHAVPVARLRADGCGRDGKRITTGRSRAAAEFCAETRFRVGVREAAAAARRTGGSRRSCEVTRLGEGGASVC